MTETISILTTAEARSIAKEAYVYGFPLVDNYRSLHASFVDRGGREFKAPWNEIHNEARVYSPEDRTVQTPNSDTPYSHVGTDLRTEPLVVSVPAIEGSRYYSAQFIDAYTFNYAYVGSRTTGNAAGHFLLAGPDWKGEDVSGVTAVIRCETEIGRVLFRTQLFGLSDLDNVKQIQARYVVQPLSAFLDKPAPVAAPTIDFIAPLTADAERKSPEFFRVLDFVLRFCPTLDSERDIRATFARLGVGTGTFDAAKLSPDVRKAIEEGIADALREFADFKRTQLDMRKRSSADLFGTRTFLNGDYMARMAGAMLGIYGNSKDEAMCPAYLVDSGGLTLDASKHRYTMRFPPGELPPVNAFWSLTMYELPSSLLVANPLGRHSINSPMLPSVRLDADGGLTLYVQRESPGGDRDSNWLPAPNGPFFAVLRLYWPKKDAVNGTWREPQLVATA